MILSSCKKHPAPTATPPKTELPPSKPDLWKEFQGTNALKEAQTLIQFGPRPSGTTAIQSERNYIVDQLTKLGWQLTRQTFKDKGPNDTQIEYCNLIARYSKAPINPSRFIIAAHYDTYRISTAPVVGATDGGANTAILLELARVLTLDPRLASSIELLFLDGHEGIHQLSFNDGLFGSHFYIQMLQLNKQSAQIRGFLSLENLGCRNFHLAIGPGSDANLVQQLQAASQVTGTPLEKVNRPVLTDQIPFQQAGIPTISLLDPNASCTDTADDNLSQLDAESLGKIGRLITASTSLWKDQ